MAIINDFKAIKEALELKKEVTKPYEESQAQEPAPWPTAPGPNIMQPACIGCSGPLKQQGGGWYCVHCGWSSPKNVAPRVNKLSHRCSNCGTKCVEKEGYGWYCSSCDEFVG